MQLRRLLEFVGLIRFLHLRRQIIPMIRFFHQTVLGPSLPTRRLELSRTLRSFVGSLLVALPGLAQ